MSDRLEKLKALKKRKAVKQMEIITDGSAFIEVLETTITEFKQTVAGGVDVNNLDDILEQLEKVKSLTSDIGKLKDSVDELSANISGFKPVEVQDHIEVKGLDSLVQACKSISRLQIKTDTIDIKPVVSNLKTLIQKIDKIKVPAQGQKPEDFVPMRRVVKVDGVGLLYDDSFYTGGGGGGSGGDFINQSNRPTQVKLGADGSVPVDIQDGVINITGPVTIPGEIEVANDSGSPVPVSAASLPLPTGAATAANQQTNALTDAQLRATPVPVSGTVTANTGLTQPLTDTQLRASDVKITLDGESVPVTGAFYQATQPISGTVTANPQRGSTTTSANVSTSTTVATLVASNASRIKATVYNDSLTGILYVKEGAAASTSSFDYALAAATAAAPGGTLICDDYTGIITGILSAGTGTARVGET